MALAMLTLKIYLGYTRVRRNITNIICINKEFVIIEGGYSNDWSKIPETDQLWKKGWIDNMAEMMQARDLTLNVNTRRSSNKTVMDYILEYTSDTTIWRNINYIRMYKLVYLPVELVGSKGGSITECYVV